MAEERELLSRAKEYLDRADPQSVVSSHGWQSNTALAAVCALIEIASQLQTLNKELCMMRKAEEALTLTTAMRER